MATYNIVQQQASIAAASVTHSSAATADTIITTNRPRRCLLITNSFDKAVMVTFNGADLIELPAFTPFTVDAGSDELQFDNAKVVGVYHMGVQPTTGRMSVTCL